MNQDKTAQKYFSLASKKSKRGSKTKSKSDLALADLYFNQNKFAKALPLYKKSINKYNDKWWTKDAFNMAWSYYRVNDFNNAIKLMLKIYDISDNPKFIDMKSAVVRDIGLFYADAKKTKDGVEFYKKLGKDYPTELLNLSGRLKKNGQLAQAQVVLLEALLAENDPRKRVKIKIAQLELYDTFGKDELHYEACNSLVDDYKEGIVSSDDFDILKYQIARKAALLQKKVVSSDFRKIEKFRYRKAKLAIKMFDLQKSIEPKQADKVLFLQGETSYIIKELEEAIKYYMFAFDVAYIKNSDKMCKAALDGMLHTVSTKSLKNKNNFYIDIYTRYLKYDSKSNKAVLIYQKLFKVYLSKNMTKEASELLNDFREKHPKEEATQEAMIAAIMDYHLKRNQLTDVKSWISKVDSGEYKVSMKYKSTLKDLLTKIQMKEAQTNLNSGNKAEALRGYLSVYSEPNSTIKAKKNSAYNLAVLFYELDDGAEVINWSNKALNIMSSSDTKKFAKTFLTFSSYFFEKQELDNSFSVASATLNKLCLENTDIKSLLFLNNSFILMSDSKFKELEMFITASDKCGISANDLNKVYYELAKQYSLNKVYYSDLDRVLDKLEKYSKMRPKLIHLLDKVKELYLEKGRIAEARSIESKQLAYFNQSKRKGIKMPLKSLEVISKLKLIPLEREAEVIDNLKLEFPENKFNSLLTKKINMLKSLTENAKTVVEVGASYGIVRSFKVLINSYRKLANEISSFRPPGKSPEFIKSFVNAMSVIYKPLLNQAVKYEKTLKKDIVKNELLTIENAGVFTNGDKST